MKLKTKYFMPFGMIGVIFYFIHVFLGQILWDEYNWITTDISSLTAKGAPNSGLLSIFVNIYGICAIIFFIGMIMKAREKGYHKITKLGYVLFLISMAISTLGYSLFPLEGNKTEMTFNNFMHIVVTVSLVVLILASMFILAFGYLKKEKIKRFGSLTLGFAFAITFFGILTPIGMTNNWNILGVTERLNIFSLEIFIFLLSYMYSFKDNMLNKA